jgi:predicted O-methyltransferase YrrM
MVRSEYLHSDEVIEIVDFGAGSTIFKDNKRKVSQLAAVSAMTDKYGALLFRMVKHFKPKTIVELGSCIGIGTSWQAIGHDGSKLFTIEGDPSSHAITKHTVSKLALKNVCLLQGTFEEELPKLLELLESVDFVFIDGNHREKPTLEYFNLLKPRLNKSSVVIFDDIHLTQEMERAWTVIKADSDVVLTVDIFRFGMVFFNEGVVKQNFIIRF